MWSTYTATPFSPSMRTATRPHHWPGWASSVVPDIGWFVGVLELEEDLYFFATNIEWEGSKESLGKISQDITLEILSELGLIKD